MLREVPMRMYSSLTEEMNVLREARAQKHGVSIPNTVIFSDTLCRITRVRNIAHPRIFGTLFIYYSSTIFQFLDSIY